MTDPADQSAVPSPSPPEWFDAPDAAGEPGLRFACTLCGNCCSGHPGYVGFTHDEAVAIAAQLGVTTEIFYDRYTRDTVQGRSIIDLRIKDSEHGHDCVFLDRDTMPGKAVCGIYEVRPTQCRTWPFWGSVIESRATWDDAAGTCPGINTGPRHDPAHIRLTRDRVDI